MFFWNSLDFLYDPVNVGNLISGSSALSKSRLYSWKFSVHVLLKPGLRDFEHNLASMWNGYNCSSLKFFGIYPSLGLEWKQTFSSSMASDEFSKFVGMLGTALYQQSSFRVWNSSAGILSPPLALFAVLLLKAHLTSRSRMFGFRWVSTPSQLSGSIKPFL